MAKEIMDRRASDNVYLHMDFHGALSAGIEYLHDRFGGEAVGEYLHDFALSYYAPLTDRLKREGLSVLRDHFRDLYDREGGEATIELHRDELSITVEACPAVTHMRNNGYPVARLFRETTATVNEAVCEGTPYAFELLGYDEETGASRMRFFRREP